ncbi:MAG: NAD-dependent epimerase/dehydratase family protein [bacterium]|nr:NAD-dependent epimerase/dehydratase family protein [bacterium]
MKPGEIILVTGATGLVGSALCARLAGMGGQVRALVRPTSDTSFVRTLDVELAEGDIADDEDCRRAAQGVGTVFHCAAYVSDWAGADEMQRVNVEGLQAMMEAALASGVGRFVYLSSLAVLGHDPQVNIDESAPFVLTGDGYNRTKIEAERLALQYHQERGLAVSIIRPPYIYGPRDRQMLPRLLSNLQSGTFRYIGAGDQPLSLVYVENLIDAMLAAAERPEAVGQVYLITDGEPVTRRQLVEAVCDGLGLDRPTRTVPVGVAKVACRLLEATYRLAGRREAPLLNRFRLKFMATPLTFSIEKARRELGWEPRVSFADGMAATLAQWREQEAAPPSP